MASQVADDGRSGVVVKYIAPDAVEDMPDLVGMRVTSIQGDGVKTLSLEEVLTRPAAQDDPQADASPGR